MPNSQHPFRFSRTALLGLKPSVTLTMNDRIREMMASGREVYHLGFGESRFPVHPLVAQAFTENVQRRSYLPALGIPSLRQAIASFYGQHFGMEVGPEQVIVGPGSKSLLYAMMVALDGDVLLPAPSWVSYESQAQLASRPLLPVPMNPDCDYELDVARLQEAVDGAADQWRRPDMIIINTPHNPTGTVMSDDTARRFAEFARERELMVLSDEIYGLVSHDPTRKHVSPAHYYPEGTIVFGGLSKHMSLGGWRFGTAILPAGESGAALARAAQAVAGSTWSCVAAPVQFAALVAYSDDPEINAYVECCAGMHAIRTRYLYEALVEFGLNCPEPAGGFYLYPSFAKWRTPLAKRGVQTCRELAMYLLENYELAVLPGSSFGDDPQALSLRLSTSFLDMETDEQAAGLIKAYAQNSDAEALINSHHPRLRHVVERLADLVSELEEDL